MMTKIFNPENMKPIRDSFLASNQIIYDFENGYGASVIKGAFSYGGAEGLYELAVLRAGKIDYNSGITEDVLGSLTVEEVEDYLQQIRALPSVLGA